MLDLPTRISGEPMDSKWENGIAFEA